MLHLPTQHLTFSPKRSYRTSTLQLAALETQDSGLSVRQTNFRVSVAIPLCHYGVGRDHLYHLYNACHGIGFVSSCHGIWFVSSCHGIWFVSSCHGIGFVSCHAVGFFSSCHGVRFVSCHGKWFVSSCHGIWFVSSRHGRRFICFLI